MILSFIQDLELNHQAQNSAEKVKELKKEPGKLVYTYENSFESKYLHFKERIEKDRLTWETLANKK